MNKDTSRRRTVITSRHSALVRLTHWLNVLCLFFLLLSGLQIFNAYPRLHWGQYGADNDPAFIEIGSGVSNGQPYGAVTIDGRSFITSGVLGLSTVHGMTTARAFPTWLTIPSYQDLPSGRRWHFFFAWVLVTNGFAYLVYGLLSGHFLRDLKPSRRELAPRQIWQEIVGHLRLRFHDGEDGRRYNVLQKFAYIAVIAIILPLMVVTGLTMSPGMNAAFPALLDIFGGRQSARTIHFITASLLVLFVIAHIAMVILSGPWNLTRSMITGRYEIRQEGQDS